MGEGRTCRFCGRTKTIVCMNSRDAEDFAIDGDVVCLRALASHDMGEKGLRYIVMNYVDAILARLAKGEKP